MDKEKATRILAKELVKSDGQKFVTDHAYKKHLLEQSLSCYPVKYEKPFSFTSKIYWPYEGGHVLSIEQYNKNVNDYRKEVVDYCTNVNDANYVFVEHAENLSFNESYSLLHLADTFSFFALIREEEAEHLRKRVYKDVQPEVICAMNTLGIKHYVDVYRLYISNNFLEILDALSVSKKFTDFVSELSYDNDGEVGKSKFDIFEGIDVLNKCFEKLKVKTFISLTEYRQSTSSGYVHRKNLAEVVEELRSLPAMNLDSKLIDDFFNFVFFLPDEDQNIEYNKAILKSYSQSLNYKQVLVKEYSEGDHFCEYFDILSNDLQEEVVKSLKNDPCKKKPVYDSFLWSKGFKDIELDYLNFYKEKASIFIEYFSQRGADEKKVILQDIMNCDFVNEEVANWLNQNEVELLREVGLNG